MCLMLNIDHQVQWIHITLKLDQGSLIECSPQEMIYFSVQIENAYIVITTF